MASVKGIPQAVHQFSQGRPEHSYNHYAASSSTPHSFRSAQSPSSSTPSDDFGSFAGPSHSSSSTFSPPVSRLSEAWQSASLPGGGSPLSRDGDDVLALLGGAQGSLSEAVDGDWESELRERQSEKWRMEVESSRPADPFASARARATRDGSADDGKGKGRADAIARAGDMSPTSSELLSSLSSLDLSSRTYLRSLLSLPPELALEDYLVHGSYVDDVHGLPKDVQGLFEKAAAQERGNGTTAEESRMKAVRRLDMVMRHLQAAETTTTLEEGTRKISLEEFKSVGMPEREWQNVGDQYIPAGTAQYDWQDSGLERSTTFANQNAAVFASPAYAQSQAVRQTPVGLQNQYTASSAYSSSSAVSQSYTIPSSLSSDAFVTFSPPSAAATSSAVAHSASAHAASFPLTAPHDLSDGPLPSFASYFADHHRRVRTNDGGRHGVDFTSPLPRGPSGVYGFGRNGDEHARVEEGRSH